MNIGGTFMCNMPYNPMPGCPTSPATGGYPTSPAMPGYPTCPAMPGYPAYPTMGGYPPQTLEMMYPEIHYIIHYKVKEMCMMMDTPYNPEMYPYPSKAMIERMTDEIYTKTVIEIGDPEMGAENSTLDFTDPEFRRRRFGGRQLLRDLIGIILIRELLQRRGRTF